MLGHEGLDVPGPEGARRRPTRLGPDGIARAIGLLAEADLDLRGAHGLAATSW